jgi:hypothetical protein
MSRRCRISEDVAIVNAGFKIQRRLSTHRRRPAVPREHNEGILASLGSTPRNAARSSRARPGHKA